MAVQCNNPAPQPITYYIDLDLISKVEIRNVKGNKVLSSKQLEKFKEDFSSCFTEPHLELKTGSLLIIFTFKNGETYVASLV